MLNNGALKNESLANDSPLLKYIEDEAQKLSGYSEYEINNYIDREVLNQEMQNYLNTVYADRNFFYLPISLTLSFYENIIMAGHPMLLPNWFADTKEKIKIEICRIMLVSDGHASRNWKATIKTILQNLNPILGAEHDLSAIVTPIIIGYIAKMIKLGYEEVCVV